jgi:hypothetical protein
MNFQHFYGHGPHPILWAGSRAARGKITVSGKRNFIIYCNILYCILNLQMWPRAAKYEVGRGLETHALGNSGCKSLPNVLIFHSQLITCSLIEIKNVRSVTQCSLDNIFQRFGENCFLRFRPWRRGQHDLPNAGKPIPDYTASHTNKQSPSQ